MRSPYFPYIVLYSLGLALFLSLIFNGYLLYSLSRQEIKESSAESFATTLSQKSSYWKQQYIECDHNNHSKDSLIRILKHYPLSDSLAIAKKNKK